MKNLVSYLEIAFLDYCNNFLTVEAFAEHYNMTVTEATIVLDAGYKINAKIYEL